MLTNEIKREGVVVSLGPLDVAHESDGTKVGGGIGAIFEGLETPGIRNENDLGTELFKNYMA